MIGPNRRKLPLHLDVVELDLLTLVLDGLLDAEDDLMMWETLRTLHQPQLQGLEHIRRKIAFVARVMRLPQKGGGQ